MIPGVISGILRGSPVDCTLGTQVRDFMHIADVAEALVGLVDRDVEGAVNIGTGIGVSLRTVVESIIARLGGAEYVRFGALPMRSGDPSHLVADPTRLQREVGVTPRYSLQQGIDDTVGRWRAAVAGNQ